MYIEGVNPEQVNSLLSDINNTILLLSRDRFSKRREKHLRILKEEINNLSRIIAYIFDKKDIPSVVYPSVTQRVFSRTELTKYNGISGFPAYVAVNGIVYDVTNNAAWAAATHFGLTAGGDYTSEFAACHAGRNTLQNLNVVGSLSDE